MDRRPMRYALMNWLSPEDVAAWEAWAPAEQQTDAEILGGFVILETDTEAQALAIAAEWPSLATQPNATVQLQPVFVRG